MSCSSITAISKKVETKGDLLRGESLRGGIGKASSKVRAPTPQTRRGTPARTEVGMGR